MNSTLSLAMVIGYSIAMIAVGIWSRAKARSRNGFFVAGRQGSLPLITGSLLATAVGASATVGMAGLGFQQGLTGAWWLLVGSIGLALLGVFLARRVRKAALYTLPELVERQYGRRVSLAASILIVIAWMGVVAGQVVAAGKVLSSLGIGSSQFWMVAFTLVFVGYCLLGGQYSVIRTDLLQTAIIFPGIFLALALVLSRIGGIEGLRESLPSSYFSFPLSSGFNAKMLASYLILVGSTYLVGPDMYSRLFCSREENTARTAAILTALLFLPMAFAITFLGMGARVLCPGVAPEDALPKVMTDVFPPALSLLVLAALVAALMSSADTCLLSQSIILSQDIIKQIFPAIEEKKTLTLTRISVIALGLIDLGIALVLRGVIPSLLFAYSIFTCGLVPSVVAGFYRDKTKVTPQGALAALIGGGVTGLLGKIPGLDLPLKGDLGLIGFAVSALLLWGISFLTRKKRAPERAESVL